MSITGAGVSGGAIEPTTPGLSLGGDAVDPGATSAASAAPASRGSGATGRMRVMAESLRPPGGAAAPTGIAVAHEIAGASAAILDDGSIVPTDSSIPGGPLAALTRLVLEDPQGPGPFGGVDDPALLSRVAEKLLATRDSLLAPPPDEGTQLAWRQGRAAVYHLLEQAAIRALGLRGGKRRGKRILRALTDGLPKEPWRPLRDFAYESLLGRAKAEELPEIGAAREALYPDAPPYDKWLANGRIDITMYVDDEGSPLEDQLRYLTKDYGFKDQKNPDGSHTLTKKGVRGQPPLRITIPEPSSTPSLFERMDDPDTDAIFYLGHAGYGHRADYALAHGVEGSGDGKLVALFQCWGLGNAESIERAYPDAQFLSTVPSTHDGFDWLMLESMFRGFQRKEGWDTIHERATGWLKNVYGSDPEYDGKDWDAHFFTPTARSVLVERYDRDGDGVPDQGDHIFNVVYPKRTGAAGGYDPVAQPMPAYALDGTELSAAVGAMSLVVRYDHPLEPALEAKLPWRPELWKPGGFYTSAPDDLRAFRFTRGPDGGVKVALSTRFAHTQKEDLSRMLAYEAGLWLGADAGLEPSRRAALGLALTQRVVHQQSGWFRSETVLDEPDVEEQLFSARYGITGVTFAQLDHAVGEVEDYGPAQLRAVEALAAGIPDLAALADRAPTRIGGPIEVPDGVRRTPLQGPSMETLYDLLRTLGIEGEVTGFSPPYVPIGEPANLVVYVRSGAETFQVSLAIDDQRSIQTASRLHLDLDRLAEQSVLRDLRAIAAKGEGLDPGAMLAAYRAGREGGRSFADALTEVLLRSRARLPLGFELPLLPSLDRLAELGILPRRDYETLRGRVRAMFPGAAQGDLVRVLDALTPAVDLEAVYRRSLGDDTGPAARLRAVRATADAIPTGTRVTTQGWLAVVKSLGAGFLIPSEDGTPTMAALADKLGVSRVDLVAAAVSQVVSGSTRPVAPGGSGLPPGIGAAATEAAEQAARLAMQQGASLGDATLAGVEAFVRAAGDVDLELSVLPLALHGLIQPFSAEAGAISERLEGVAGRNRAEGALLRQVAGASGDAFPEVRARFDAAAARLGSRTAAAAWLATGTPGLAPAGEWLEAALPIAPLTGRADLADRLFAATGGSREAEVRRRLAEALASSPAQGRSAVVAVVGAFDAAIARGAGVDVAAVAAVTSTAPAALPLYVIPSAIGSLLSPAARLRLRDVEARAGAEMRLLAWIEAEGQDPSAALAAHADRLEAGASYADSYLQLLRAAPDASVRQDFSWPEDVLEDAVGALLPLPVAARARGLEMLLAKAGTDLPTAIWNAVEDDLDGVSRGQLRAGETALREALGRGVPLEEALRGAVQAFGQDGPRLPADVLDDLERGGLLSRADRDGLARDRSTGGASLGRDATRIARALLEEPVAASALATAIVDAARRGGPVAAIARLATGLEGKTVSGGAESLLSGALRPAQTWLRAVPEGERAAATGRLLAAAGRTREDLVVAIAERSLGRDAAELLAGSGGEFHSALRAAVASDAPAGALSEINRRFGVFGAFQRGRLADSLQNFGLATEAEAAALLEPPVVD